MRILITGGAGFVGANLAKHLKSKGNDVVVMDNLVRRGSELNLPAFKELGIRFIHGDVRNKEDFLHFNGIYDFIMETSAQPSACTGYNNPTFDITNNFNGLLNVLEFARLDNSKVIFWSTNKVYCGDKINALGAREGKTRFHSKNRIAEDFPIDGGDHSIYGLSKVCADLTCQEWAKAFGLKVVINRFSCLAGTGQFGRSEQGWISWFIVAHMLKLPITLYGFKGKQVRDVLFMPDILKLIDIQIEKIDEISGEVFNIGGGDINTSLLECIDLIRGLTGWKTKVVYEPKRRKSDQCVYITDISKAKKILNWKPEISMNEGLHQIIFWARSKYSELGDLYK